MYLHSHARTQTSHTLWYARPLAHQSKGSAKEVKRESAQTAQNVTSGEGSAETEKSQIEMFPLSRGSAFSAPSVSAPQLRSRSSEAPASGGASAADAKPIKARKVTKVYESDV